MVSRRTRRAAMQTGCKQRSTHSQLSVPQGWAHAGSRRRPIRQAEHLGKNVLHLTWLERLRDDGSPAILHGNQYRLAAVTGQESKGYAPRREDGTDRKAGPTIQVDV